MDALTPREIVAELDKYIVGQDAAKRAVAIALRNRWRRQQLAPELRDEIAPKNIIMIGPTGVGKTELAKQLARVLGALEVQSMPIDDRSTGEDQPKRLDVVEEEVLDALQGMARHLGLLAAPRRWGVGRPGQWLVVVALP